MKIEVVKKDEDTYYVVDPSKDPAATEHVMGIVSLNESGMVPGAGERYWLIEDLRQPDFRPKLETDRYEDRERTLAFATAYFSIDIPAG